MNGTLTFDDQIAFGANACHFKASCLSLTCFASIAVVVTTEATAVVKNKRWSTLNGIRRIPPATAKAATSQENNEESEYSVLPIKASTVSFTPSRGMIPWLAASLRFRAS